MTKKGNTPENIRTVEISIGEEKGPSSTVRIKVYPYVKKLKDGQAPMYLEITSADSAGKKKCSLLSMGVPINMKAWNQYEGNLIGNQYALFNARFQKLLNRLSATIKEIEVTDVKVIKEKAIETWDEITGKTEGSGLVPEEPEPATDGFANILTALTRREGIKPNTKRIYLNTLSKLEEYTKGKIYTMTLTEVDRDFLIGYTNYLKGEKGNSLNTINIEMRNIRTAFNYAKETLGLQLTDSQIPFGKRKGDPLMKTEQTGYDYIPAEHLRALFLLDCEEEGLNEAESTAIDIMKLSFLLGGINPVDMFNLEVKDYSRGTISVRRSKMDNTYSTGMVYQIPIIPQAIDLWNRIVQPSCCLRHQKSRNLSTIRDTCQLSENELSRHLIKSCAQFEDDRTWYHVISGSIYRKKKKIAAERKDGKPITDVDEAIMHLGFNSIRYSFASLCIIGGMSTAQVAPMQCRSIAKSEGATARYVRPTTGTMIMQGYKRFAEIWTDVMKGTIGSQGEKTTMEGFGLLG